MQQEWAQKHSALVVKVVRVAAAYRAAQRGGRQVGGKLPLMETNDLLQLQVRLFLMKENQKDAGPARITNPPLPCLTGWKLPSSTAVLVKRSLDLRILKHADCRVSDPFVSPANKLLGVKNRSVGCRVLQPHGRPSSAVRAAMFFSSF